MDSKLLHYVLESLSVKRDLCDTYDNLSVDVKQQLVFDRNPLITDADHLICSAVKAGEEWGILTLATGVDQSAGNGERIPLTSNVKILPDKLLEVGSKLVAKQKRASTRAVRQKLRATHRPHRSAVKRRLSKTRTNERTRERTRRTRRKNVPKPGPLRKNNTKRLIVKKKIIKKKCPRNTNKFDVFKIWKF